MFRKLWEKAETANFKAAARRGALACPNCGAKPAAIPASTRDLITCVQCGTKASAFEWTAAASPGELTGNPDRPPANTKIARLADPSGAVVWNIPASGKSGGFLFFAFFWCSITAIVSGALLFGDGKPATTHGDPGTLLPALFIGIFWAIGLGMLYIALRNKFAKHRLTANRTNITLRRELFGRATDKSLPADSITTIEKTQFYQQNYEPVYGIEIKGRRGKLRFGSVLTEEEKAWLVADLKRVVFGTPAPSTPVRPAATPEVRPSGTRQSYFSFPLPMTGRNLWPIAVLLTLIGGAFVCVGIFFLDPMNSTADGNDPIGVRVFEMFFAVLSGGFRIIWLTMSAAMATGGIAMGIWLTKSRNRETRIEGTDSEIAIRVSRHGLVLKERVFPRASVTDIRAAVCGSVNDKTMKQVELIVGDKAETVSRWLDGEKADALVEEVRRAL